MISVVILGNGNVATHLTNAFSQAKNVQVIQLSAHNLVDIPPADVTIISVSDDAIDEVSSKIKNGLVVHTAGSISIDALKNEGRKGVFYPLQTFSKEKKIEYSEIPFCLEATNPEDYNLLEKLAKNIGKKVFSINSEQRKAMHISAVFVSNFVNHLYKIGADICQTNKVPFEILVPLISETAKKIEILSPQKAQTGPAIRNDQKTIENHLFLLSEEHQKIYTTLTKSIQNGIKL